MEWKVNGGMRLWFPQEFSVGPELDEVEGCVVGKLNGPQLVYVLRVVVGNSGIDLYLAIWTGQCIEIRMEGNSGHEMGVSLEIVSQT